MDIPNKKRIKGVSNVTFDHSESSGSDDGDSVFNKYSCTPPSRHNIKGMQKRRETRTLNSPKVHKCDGIILPKNEKDKLEKSPTHRWQQREISKLRDSERVMKWITSSDQENPLSTCETSSSVNTGVSSEDDAVASESRIPSKGIKVFELNFFIPNFLGLKFTHFIIDVFFIRWRAEIDL